MVFIFLGHDVDLVRYSPTSLTFNGGAMPFWLKRRALRRQKATHATHTGKATVGLSARKLELPSRLCYVFTYTYTYTYIFYT